MTNYTLSEVHDEQERGVVHRFLTEQITDDKLAPLLPLTSERQFSSVTTTVVRADDAVGNLVGAAIIGPDWPDLEGAFGAAPVLGWALLKRVRALHAIAVDPAHRNGGLGQELLLAAEKAAIDADVRMIVGVAKDIPELKRFYARHNYSLGMGGQFVVLRMAISPEQDAAYVMSQKRSDQYFFFKTIDHLDDLDDPLLTAAHASREEVDNLGPAEQA